MAEVEIFLLADDAGAARTVAQVLFEHVRNVLAAIMPPTAEIRHIGATAIPGCLTKGDLDIAVRVDAQEFPAADQHLERRYARNLGSVRLPTFAAFEDGCTEPHLGIQLVARGSKLDDFHRFADALLADPGLVRDYNRLKQTWHGKPMDDYRRAKDAFVARVLAG